MIQTRTTRSVHDAMYKVHRASSIPAQTPLGGGARIPPNATKVFYRWGMEKRLREVAVRSQGILFAQCESSHYSTRSPPPHVRPDDSGSVVGSHQWEEEVLEETGGDFLLIHVRHLAHTHNPPNSRFSSLLTLKFTLTLTLYLLASHKRTVRRSASDPCRVGSRARRQPAHKVHGH